MNLTEGGPLTVLRDFVDASCAVLPADWAIVVMVHDRQLLTNKRARLVEVRRAKRSWLRRMWVEWYEFRKCADRLAPDLWVSLHDITPNVGSVRQIVYCHNANPFFSTRIRDVLFQPTQLFFRLGYALLYRVNLRRNAAIVVQQAWIRERFRRWVGNAVEIIVAHPEAPLEGSSNVQRRPKRDGRAVFLYPTLPRPFKNLELICRAVELLERTADWKSEVIFTIDGNENRYAQWLLKKFSRLKSVRFMGRQSRDEMMRLYAEADCLVFASRMETWGLPISEAKRFGLPMFVSDMPYARETVGTYAEVDFIDIDDYSLLSQKLLAFQNGNFHFRPAVARRPDEPFVRDWCELAKVLIEGYSDGGFAGKGRAL